MLIKCAKQFKTRKFAVVSLAAVPASISKAVGLFSSDERQTQQDKIIPPECFHILTVILPVNCYTQSVSHIDCLLENSPAQTYRDSTSDHLDKESEGAPKCHHLSGSYYFVLNLSETSSCCTHHYQLTKAE